MAHLLLFMDGKLSLITFYEGIPMQDVTSFVNSASPLSLAPSTGSETKKAANEKSSDSKSFMAVMLAQLAEASNTKTTTKSSKEGVDKNSETSTPVKSSAKEAKSVDEHLLEDLLKLTSALKAGTQQSVFPTIQSSSRLEKILNNETALKEFASVKNVGDLMALSKKYDLGLEKLSFSKESLESLQKAFPTLAKTNFFEHLNQEMDAQEAPLETPQKVETTTTINPLEKNVKKSETTPVTSVLKELMSQETTEAKQPKIETKEASKHLKEIPTETVETELVGALEGKQPSKEVKLADAPNELKKTTPTVTETVIQKAATPMSEEVKSDKKIKVETPSIVNAKLEETPIEIKPSSQTRITEPKMENTHTTKGLVEAVLQTVKIEKPVVTTTVAEEENVVVTPTLVQTEESHKIETTETKPVTLEVKSTQKQELSTKQTLTPKESLGQFASDLKEKIEAYKPPVMKVELALNPRNLGEVDVTILTRGSNLHVNISSNSNTMTLFTQNQAEFKNALVNMGFTQLEMNFSDQRGHEQGQQQQKNAPTGFFDDLSEENLAETVTTVELVVPRYV